MCRITFAAGILAGLLLAPAGAQAAETREAAIARAQVWMPTNVAAKDIMKGPERADGFDFLETVYCEFTTEDLSGASPKFECRAEGIPGDDDLKVKYGGDNAEVYAEVAASRLLWALGFGADAMYPVRVVCRDCPPLHGSILRVAEQTRLFDPASIERKMEEGRGEEISDYWHWDELDEVDEEAGGAPRAHRDALKLLAVFLQHSDSKPEQQRLICLDGGPQQAQGAGAGACARPFMLMQDVGLTFGRANRFNTNDETGMNLAGWSSMPIWKEGERCVGNLPESNRGTLADPEISEEGRAFLADLLMQLSDEQIRDLFEVSRVTLRVRDPGDAKSGFPTVDEWVQVFKDKRAQIVDERCA